MANTVSILSLANTFGEWFSSTNALAKENNDLAANNYIKSTGTLFLEDNDLGLHVANNAVIQGGLQVYGVGSSGYIENNLRVGKQVYFTNNVIGLTNFGQANVYGLLYANATGNSIYATNDIVVGGDAHVKSNVYAEKSLIVVGSAHLSNTITVLGAANVDNYLAVTQNVTIGKSTITRDLHANNAVWTQSANITSFLDVSLGASQLHIVTANNFTSPYGYINILQSNTKINAETTNTTTLNSYRIDSQKANISGELNVIAGGVSNFDIASANVFNIKTVSADYGYIKNLQSNTSINAETATVSTLTATNFSTPTANISTVIDANNARAYLGTVQTIGNLSVGGDFVINGTTVYNSNTFTISTGNPGTISSYTVYREGADANASIRWYEPGAYWDIKDVGTGSYSRIMLRSDINDTLTSTSTTQVATARVANTLNENFVTANTFLQNAVRSSSSYANAAFTAANNAMIAGGQVAGSYANSAFGVANASFIRANTSLNTITGTSGTTATPNVGGITLVGSYGVTAVATSNTVTISTPQDLRTSASPSFTGLTLTNALPIAYGGTGATSASDARTALLPRGEVSGYVLATGGEGSYYWAAGGTGGGSGASPGTTISTVRSTTTASASQTKFYTPGAFTVGAGQTRIFVNGVKQYPGDYSESVVTLSGVSIASTTGAFTCTSTSGLTVGRALTVVGSLTGTGTITGYYGSKTYYIIATNGTTTFTLSETQGGSAIETTTGTTTGLTFATNYAVDLNTGVYLNDSVLIEIDGYYVNPYYANNISFTVNNTIGSGAITIQSAIDTLAAKAVQTSGADFTGITRTLTAAPAVSNTQIATTDFVHQFANAGYVLTSSVTGSAGSVEWNNISNKPAGLGAQIQTDWNATSGLGQILNKPTLSTVATTGSYLDLSNKPTIPAAQVQSDWSAVSGLGVILNKPTIPTNTNQLTNGSGFITSAALSGYALTSSVPTNTNQLTNGAGFITSAALSGYATTSTSSWTPSSGTFTINSTFAKIQSGNDGWMLLGPQTGGLYSGVAASWDSTNGYWVGVGYQAGTFWQMFKSGWIASSVADVRKPGGGSFNVLSDLRQKENVVGYDKGLQDILKLRPVNFNYIGKTGEDTKHKKFTGLIAQEVEETSFRTMVNTDDDGTKTVDNSELIYALVNTVKELNQKIETLQAEVVVLKGKIK